MSSTQPPAADDHLPARLTELVGRERDVAATCALLRQDVRLLTLTGAGGIGKTRLAVAIAHTLRSEFAGGVCFVSLAPITDPDLVVSAIAHALGLRDGDARSPWDRLTDHLRGRQRLLVLDNFEQVAADGARDALPAARGDRGADRGRWAGSPRGFQPRAELRNLRIPSRAGKRTAMATARK